MEHNLSVQVTARAEPLWKIIVNLKNYNLYGKPVETLAATDFCVSYRTGKLDTNMEQKRSFIIIKGEVGKILFRHPFSELTFRRQQAMVLVTTVLALIALSVIELQSGAIQGLSFTIKNTTLLYYCLAGFSCLLLIMFWISVAHDLVSDHYTKLSAMAKMHDLLLQYIAENKVEREQLIKVFEAELAENDQIHKNYKEISERIRKDIEELEQKTDKAIRQGK